MNTQHNWSEILMESFSFFCSDFYIFILLCVHHIAIKEIALSMYFEQFSCFLFFYLPAFFQEGLTHTRMVRRHRKATMLNVSSQNKPVDISEKDFRSRMASIERMMDSH